MFQKKIKTVSLFESMDDKYIVRKGLTPVAVLVMIDGADEEDAKAFTRQQFPGAKATKFKFLLYEELQTGKYDRDLKQRKKDKLSCSAVYVAIANATVAKYQSNRFEITPTDESKRTKYLEAQSAARGRRGRGRELTGGAANRIEWAPMTPSPPCRESRSRCVGDAMEGMG